MESVDSIELGDSSDFADKNIEVSCENNEVKEQEITHPQMSHFLTASELCSLRVSLAKNKGKDEDLELYKGNKFYYPSECAAYEEIVEDIMHCSQKGLELQRIAKNKECLKAVWNDELNVATVPYLKHKTTQHMGSNMKGACALSPEEALFLMEKGIIEVEYNKMPLSIEEAYAVMLKGKLSVEKYEVYSHLSQQGFIVVRHQQRVGTKYMKVMNLTKRKQKKRKADPSMDLPEQKRLTFTGVLASNSEINPINVERITTSDSQLNEDTSNYNQFADLDTSNKNQNMTDKIEKENSEVSNEDTISSNFTNHLEANICTEKETSTSGIKEQVNESGNVLDVSSKGDENVVSSTGVCDFAKQDELNIDVEDATIEDKNDEIDVENVQEDAGKINVDKSDDNNEISVRNGNDHNKINVENAKDDYQMNVENAHDDNEINVENINYENEINVKKVDEVNGKNVEEEINVENATDEDINEVIIDDERRSDKSDDINVEDSCSDFDNNEESMSSDDSIPVVFEDVHEESSLDVYSYSPGDRGDSEHLTPNKYRKPSNLHDDEVTLVKVMKKEKKPLAVIDLLSDEEDGNSFRRYNRAAGSEEEPNETNGKEVFEDSDEEIQVLSVFDGSVNNSQATSRSVSAIKLESRKLKAESANVQMQYKPQMRFPDTFRKDLICVSRPPCNLLPFTVTPAKEAYVLNHEKSTRPKPARLWNSYRDMQEYQRERRQERQRNSFNSRLPGPFRDQPDSFSSPLPPFGSPDFSREINMDRNQSYPVPPHRNLYQPMNAERGLLPSPGSFNSSNNMPGSFNSANNMPFPANIHNLQNLSSTNPVAFVNELQKTVYSVASNMISTMLGQHLNPNNPPPVASPAFSEPNSIGFGPHSFSENFSMSSGMFGGPMNFNSSGRNDFNPVRFPPEPAFSGERFLSPMGPSPFLPENTWRPPLNNFRQRNFPPRGPSFPCRYRTVRRKRDWNDVKAAVEGKQLSDSGSDIEEVPINLNQFLCSNGIQPLIKPGSKLPIGDALKSLKITRTAGLCDAKRCVDSSLPISPSVEITFDVYLPSTKYKKSEPSVPNYRIIVGKSSDPIPRYSELVYLQRKWNDGASLQIAVVDHGDINFFSFNSITLPEIVPFDS